MEVFAADVHTSEVKKTSHDIVRWLIQLSNDSLTETSESLVHVDSSLRCLAWLTQLSNDSLTLFDIAIYGIPINWRYIYARCPALILTSTASHDIVKWFTQSSNDSLTEWKHRADLHEFWLTAAAALIWAFWGISTDKLNECGGTYVSLD